MNKYKQKKSAGNFKIIIITLSVFFLIFLFVILSFTFPDRRVQFFSTSIYGLLLAISPLVGVIILVFPFWNRNRSVKDTIKAWLISLLLILLSALIMLAMINNIKDIPNVIHSDYKILEGNLTSYHIGRTGTKSSGTRFVINGIELYIDSRDKEFFVVGDKYRVEYLPHSKFVMNLYKCGE